MDVTKSSMHSHYDAASSDDSNKIPVKTALRAGTVEFFIFNTLNGKIENAYDLALQLGGMILPHETALDVKTSAINREIGKKLTEYIAKHYLDDPAAVQSFLKGINRYAEKSEMRDKGYEIFLHLNVEPKKPAANDLFRYAKEYLGYTETDWENPVKKSAVIYAFMNELINNSPKLAQFKEEKDTAGNDFDMNERWVQSVIDEVKKTISPVTVDDHFFAVMTNMYYSPSAKWDHIVSLLNTARRIYKFADRI